MTAKPTLAEAEATLVELRGHLARHRSTLRSVEGRRRKHAFAASQRKPAAVAALEKAEGDEAAANAALRNLALAIAEAEQRLSDAQSREHEQDQAGREAQKDALSDELIEVTHEIATTIENLRDQLRERAEIVSDIVATGVLSEVPAALLSKIESQSEAIVDGLGFNFDSRVGASAGAVARFIEETYTVLGRQPPERELTTVESALLRAAFPSQSAA
jgi:hypothetical protein